MAGTVDGGTWFVLALAVWELRRIKNIMSNTKQARNDTTLILRVENLLSLI
jgi:hypothetical protein